MTRRSPLGDLAGRIFFIYNIGMMIDDLIQAGVPESVIVAVMSMEDDDLRREQICILLMGDDRREFVD